MKTDKNTIIGFVLLGLLFFGMFWFNNKDQQALLARQKQEADSLARLNARKPVAANQARRYLADSLHNDSARRISAAGNFDQAALGQEQLTAVENELLRATFSNKGGQLKSVQLKNYKAYSKQPVVLGGGEGENLGYMINTGANKSAMTSDLFFSASPLQSGTDGAQTIRFTVQSADGRRIVHQYTLRKNSYLIDFNIVVDGVTQLLTGNQLTLLWNQQPVQQQQDIKYERQQSRIAYLSDDNFDFETAESEEEINFENPVKWVSNKQQFFNTTLIAKNAFSGGSVRSAPLPDSSGHLFRTQSTLRFNLPPATMASIPLQLYYGPTDYAILRNLDNEMYQLVDLGSGIFSFVKYINRWIIIPVFNFFSSFIASYGLVILFLTLFIRLVTSPLVYSSYLSGAKMKALRPELDELKKKHGDDQQAYAMDQMKIFREAGVNMFGGCIPALLQIPIFFALYSFFNSNIALRDKSFLWADDLSKYDSIYQLPFEVPFGYGDHVSLFTITAVLTSFLISIYNISMTPQTQDNPVMKYMPYFFPFILLFIFNRLPSALTWYYTVSNIITLVLQWVIQNYIINHDQIMEQIKKKRSQPKVMSKWQQKYQDLMEQQQKGAQASRSQLKK